MEENVELKQDDCNEIINSIKNSTIYDDHFFGIDENILLKDRSDSIIYVKDDSVLLNEQLNMVNQRVVKNDCDRTRVKDKPLLLSFREYLESMLTYYCKKNNIKYKQGMNEIVGPFILIKSKFALSLSKIFNLFSSFVEKFLTNYYHEDEFFSLQSSLGLLNILLKYHEPVMFNIFEFAVITPEMYATSWILTIFANKTKLGILYYFWNMLILENDELLIHFFIVSFLRYHKDSIISTDHSQIPTVLSQLALKTCEEVEIIFKEAKNLRSITPYSLRLISRKLEIFKPSSKRLKELFATYEPEDLIIFPILPSEIFSIAYNNVVLCPDTQCGNFKNLYDGGNSTLSENDDSKKKYSCIYCENKMRDKKSKSQLPYILLDLRLSEGKTNEKHYDVKPGFLPMTVILDQNEILQENLAENLSDRFLNEKDKYHFIFITSETEYFSEFENRFYIENITEREKRKMMYGLQTKIIKEINTKLVKKSIKRDKKKRFQIKLKEYDNLKKIIEAFSNKNYSYISYVHGGFKEIHDQSLELNIPLLNHDENCFICKKNRKNIQKRGFFAKLFNKYEKKEEKIKNINSNQSNSEDKGKLSTDTKLANTSEDKNVIENNEKSKVKNEDDCEDKYNAIMVDPSKIFNIDDISNFITDTNNTVFTCLLIEFKNITSILEKGPHQIMLFLNSKEIKIFKLERKANLINNNENENLLFILVEKIQIQEIITIITRRQSKNIVMIHFTSEAFGKTSIVIDLITDVDSKSFISKTKSIIEISK